MSEDDIENSILSELNAEVEPVQTAPPKPAPKPEPTPAPAPEAAAETPLTAEDVIANPEEAEEKKFESIQDLPLTISAEFGRAKMSVGDFMEFRKGYVIELTKLAGEPLEVLMNGRLIAKGEAVIVNEKFAIRLTDIVESKDIERES